MRRDCPAWLENVGTCARIEDHPLGGMHATLREDGTIVRWRDGDEGAHRV